MKHNYLGMKAYVENNELLEDAYFINDEWFYRYYHKNDPNKPTRIFGSKSGKIWSEFTNNIIRGGYDKDGYLRTKILPPSNKRHRISIHRIICTIFHPEGYDKDMQVNHINGIKDDNRVENLEWSTCKENINHGINHGLYSNRVSGERVGTSKYKEFEIHQVCKLLEENKLNQLEISKITGVNHFTISRIAIGDQWRSISKFYNISTIRNDVRSSTTTENSTDEDYCEEFFYHMWERVW